jgi:trimeric autotransporter adhesin
VYGFNRGDGRDTIFASNSPNSGEVDTVSLGVSILPEQVAGYIDGLWLMLTIQGASDAIGLHYVDGTTGEILENPVSRVQFIDTRGTVRVFDLYGIVQTLRSELFSANEINPIPLFTAATQGYELAGTVPGAGGDEAIAYAQSGDVFALPTSICGTTGDDVIHGGTTNDTINTGEGNDTIFAGGGNDTIHAGPGTDFIDAGPGHDEILSLVGGDTALGGTGDDTYHFNLGDGNVFIDDLTEADEGNTVVFGRGIGPNSLTLMPGDDALIIKVGDNGDEISLKGFDQWHVAGSHAVDTFRFADGTVLSYAELIQRGFDLEGTEGEDLILGTDRTDRIIGLGDDDTLVAGPGNDLLDGGGGNDTYVFNLGDGIDTIRDSATPGAGNVVEFGPSVNSADFVLSTDGNTLVITVASTGDALRLEGFDPNDPDNTMPVETFRFADGIELSASQLLDLGFVFEGTPGADRLTGTGARDTFIGHGGPDQLVGEAGDDTYVFNLGDGVDTITDSDGSDTIRFGEGITRQNLQVKRDGTGVHIRILDAQERDTGEGLDTATLPDGSPVVETIRFADGSTTRVLDFIRVKNTVYGTKCSDVIRTGDAEDEIFAKGGCDVVFAGGNDDIVHGGTGSDQLNGEAGNDTLHGDSGMDVLNGGTGDDILDGGSDRDVLSGGCGNDTYIVDSACDIVRENCCEGIDTVKSSLSYTLGANLENLILTGSAASNGTGNGMDNLLIGNGAANRLVGGAGRDTLDGGAGCDVLEGGPGDDTYRFGRGSGQDRIVECDCTPGNTDVLAFGAGVSVDQIWFRRKCCDLELSIIGTQDKATITDWYRGSSHQVEQLRTNDGKALLSSQVDCLVQAMAAFAPPSSGQTTLPPNCQTALQPLIAANWR